MTTCKMRRAYEIGRFHVEDAQQQHLRADLSRALHTPLYLPVDSYQISPHHRPNTNTTIITINNNNSPNTLHTQHSGILHQDAPSSSTTTATITPDDNNQPPPPPPCCSSSSSSSSPLLTRRQHPPPLTSATVPAAPATPRGQSPVPHPGGQASPPAAPASPESLRKALAVLCLPVRSPLTCRKRSVGNLRVTFADEHQQQQPVPQQVFSQLQIQQLLEQSLQQQQQQQLHQRQPQQQQGTGRDSPDSPGGPPATPPPTPTSQLRRATVPLVSAPLAKKSPDLLQLQLQQFARGEALFRDRSSSFEQIPEEGEWTGCLSEETAREVSPGSAGSGRHSPSCGCSTCCLALNAVLTRNNGLASPVQPHSVSHRSVSDGVHASCRKELFSHVHDEEGTRQGDMQYQFLQEQQQLQQKQQRVQQQLQQQQQHEQRQQHLKLQEQQMQQKQQLQLQQQKQEQQMRLQEQQNLQQKQQQEQRQQMQLQEQLQQQEKQQQQLQQQVQHQQHFATDTLSARKATATSHHSHNSVPKGEVGKESNATTAAAAAAAAASYPSSARQQAPVSLQHLGPERNYATYPSAMAYPNMAVRDPSVVNTRFSRHGGVRGGELYGRFPFPSQLPPPNATSHARASAVPSDEFYDDRKEYATFPPMNPSVYRLAKTLPRSGEGENGLVYFNDAASSLQSWPSRKSVASVDTDSTIGSLGYYPSPAMSSYNTPGSSDASWTHGLAGDQSGRLGKDPGSHGPAEGGGNDGYRSLSQNFPPMDDFMLRRFLSEVNRMFHQSYPRSQPHHPSVPVPPPPPPPPPHPSHAVPPTALPHQQVPRFGGHVPGSYPAYPSHHRYAPPVPTQDLPPDMRGKPVRFAPLGRYLVNMLNNPSDNAADATLQGPDAFLSKFLECTCNTSAEGSWRSLCSMIRFQSQFYAGRTVFDFQRPSQQDGQGHHQRNDQSDGFSTKSFSSSSSSSGYPSTESSELPPNASPVSNTCGRGNSGFLDAGSEGCDVSSRQCQSFQYAQSEPGDIPHDPAYAAGKDSDTRTRSVSLEELSLGCRGRGGCEGRCAGFSATAGSHQQGQKAPSSLPPPQTRVQRSGSLDSCLQDAGTGTQNGSSARSQEQRSQGRGSQDQAGWSGSQDAGAFPFVPFQFGTSEEMAADFLLFCSAFGMAFTPPQENSGASPRIPASFPFPEFDPNWFRFLPGFPQ